MDRLAGAVRLRPIEDIKIANPWEQLLIPLLFLAIPLGVSFWTVTGVLDQYAEFRWFLTGLGCALLLAGGAVTGFRLELPAFRARPATWILFGITAFFALIPAVRTFPGILENKGMEWICFLVLFFWSCSLGARAESRELFLRSIRFANRIGLFAVAGYLIAQKAGFRWRYLASSGPVDTSLFGNKNFAASYFGIAVLIHLHGFRRNRRAGELLVDSIPALLGVYGLVSMKARGASLGFAAGLLLLLWSKVRWNPARKAAVAAGLFLPLLIWFCILSYRGVTPDADSRSFRLARWLNTAAMIADHPLGIGPGRYRFAYLSYSSRIRNDIEIADGRVSLTPHNLPLQIAVESGLITALAAFLALGLILVRAWRSDPATVAVAGSILVDGIFAFPLDVPYSFMAFAVFSGLAFASGGSPFTVWSLGRLRIPVLLTAAAMAVFLVCDFTAVLSESFDINDPASMRRSCERAPWRMVACLQLARIEGNHGNFREGIRLAKSVLRRQPDDFNAHFLISELYRLSGDSQSYCTHLSRYDSELGARTRFHAEVLKNCPPVTGKP